MNANTMQHTVTALHPRVLYPRAVSSRFQGEIFSISKFLNSLKQAIIRSHERRETRKILLSLSTHQLEDIGLSRAEIEMMLK